MLPTSKRDTFLTTRNFPSRKTWAARCDVVDGDKRMSKLALLRHLITEAPHFRGLIVDGSGGSRDAYIELLAAMAVRRLTGNDAPIVLGECQWKLGQSRLDRIAMRAGLRLLDGPSVAYCVLTEWERERFASTWRVDAGRVFTTPYCHTLSDVDLAAPTSEQGGIFAGGNSLRDYNPLLTAASMIDAPFFLATNLVSAPLPDNVRAGPVPEARFFELMRNARVVVVPLAKRDDRTAGQQTYLNAMALGKPTIVTDSPGVREYVEDERTGFLVSPGDPDALTRKVRWILDSENEAAVAEISHEAKRTARSRFSPDRFVESMLDVAERIARDHA